MLVLVFVPLFVVVDLVLAEPELWPRLWLTRAGLVAVTGLLWSVPRTATFVRHPVRYTAGYAVFLLAGLSVPVHSVGGLASSYYFGICLVMVGCGLLFLWPWRVALVVHGVAGVGLWVVPGLLVAGPEDLARGMAQVFFVVTMAAILVAAQRLSWRTSRHHVLTRCALNEAYEASEALRDELREANARLEAMAMQDGLTGVANRRAVDAALEREWQRHARERRPLAVILGDLDHFKVYNDTHGHLAGDACLRAVAELLGRSARRPADLVGRFGGEEFVILLPDTTEEGALVVARRVRDSMARADMAHAGTALGRVTMSMGIAACVPGSGDPLGLVGMADEALYRAKAGGRDRIELADDPGEITGPGPAFAGRPVPPQPPNKPRGSLNSLH